MISEMKKIGLDERLHSILNIPNKQSRLSLNPRVSHLEHIHYSTYSNSTQITPSTRVPTNDLHPRITPQSIHKTTTTTTLPPDWTCTCRPSTRTNTITSTSRPRPRIDIPNRSAHWSCSISSRRSNGRTRTQYSSRPHDGLTIVLTCRWVKRGCPDYRRVVVGSGSRWVWS